MLWFYKVIDEERGPCTKTELKDQAALGNIQEDTLIRRGTEGRWVSAWRVKGLFDGKSPSPAIPATVEPPPASVKSTPDALEPAPLIPTTPPFNKPPTLPPPPTSRIPAQPHVEQRTKQFAWIAVPFLIAAAAGGYALVRGSNASVNPFQSLANTGLQSKLDQVIQLDNRNIGIKVSVYYRDVISKSVIVFDLQEVSENRSRLDVFRVLLDFAESIQDNNCDTVELAFRGQTRFKLDGAYFRTLGRERDIQNPIYTIRTFPENLKTPSGNNAYPTWTGGAIGVLSKQMEDANEFHDNWYLNEITHTY